MSVLTVLLMGTFRIWTASFDADFGLCVQGARPEFAPEPFVRPIQAPFSRQPKIEVPGEAQALAHFMKGDLLLGDGDFEGALTEFESAAQKSPGDSFLHLRLATLYLRKGDLKKAQSEAETAVKLDPVECGQTHLLLAGLYTSLGENQRGLREYNEVLKIDPKNQEALLYLGALYLQLEDYGKAT